MGHEISRDKNSMTTVTPESVPEGFLPLIVFSRVTLLLIAYLRGSPVVGISLALSGQPVSKPKTPILENNRAQLENSFGKEISSFNLWQELCLLGESGSR